MEREITENDTRNLQAVQATRPILNVFSDATHTEVLAALYGHPQGLSTSTIYDIISQATGEIPKTQASTILRKLEKAGLTEVYTESDALETVGKPRVLGRLTPLGQVLMAGWLETAGKIVEFRQLQQQIQQEGYKIFLNRRKPNSI